MKKMTRKAFDDSRRSYWKSLESQLGEVKSGEYMLATIGVLLADIHGMLQHALVEPNERRTQKGEVLDE